MSKTTKYDTVFSAKKGSKIVVLMGLSFLFMVFIYGCASRDHGGNALLPSSSVESSWGNYEQAVDNYNRIKVGMTGGDLKDRGVYDGAPNVKVLNWLTVYKLLPEDAVTQRKLDQGVLDFIDAGDSISKAFKIYIIAQHQHREGSFFLDIFSFRRNTRTIGYELQGLILLVDGRVVYTQRHSGGPVNNLRKDKKPLGPLQGLESLLRSAISGAF